MTRIHRSQSFAPVLSPLEGRVLLSTASDKAAIRGAEPLTQVPTEVLVTDQGVYNKKHALTAVTIMAEVKSLSGNAMPTGSVTFDMVMTMKMQKGMVKMKSGTTDLGTVPLGGGEAMLTLKPRMVLKMPLEIVYSGDATHMSSTATPAVLTKSSLKGMSMKM